MESIVVTEDVLLNAFIHESSDSQEMFRVVTMSAHLLNTRSVT